MEEQLRRILAEVGGLAPPPGGIAIDDDLFVIGLTSLATVSVLIAIEEEFGVQIPDALLKRETFRTIASLMAVVGQLEGGEIA